MTSSVTIKSHPRHLPVARALVRQAAAAAALDEQSAYDLTLAVDEACANIIRHAYQNDPSQDITITATVNDDAIEFRIRDFGRQVDPACIKPRDLDDVRPGGLGCVFIRRAFDEIAYDTNFPSGTELRLIRHRRRAVK